MAHITLDWWKATEIPLSESEWRNVKLYCDKDTYWDTSSKCVYVICLSPPFAVCYDKGDSPIIYIGRTQNGKTFRQRWKSHIATWINPLGRFLPGGRYEMRVLEDHRYKAIESDFLFLFRESYGRLPLANLQGGDKKVKHGYDQKELDELAIRDRRYWWAIRPRQQDVKDYFDRGID